MPLDLPDVEPMSPERALEWFRELVPSMADRPLFDPDTLRRQTFTMAEATDEVMLARVQGKIAEFIESGMDRQGLVDSIEEIMDAAGVTPANSGYSEMVARTNFRSIMAEAEQAEMADPEMQDIFPVWQYLGVEDSRQGADHEVHFNKYWPVSVAFSEVRDSMKVGPKGEVVRAGPGEGRPFSCRCDALRLTKWQWAELQAQGAKLEDWPTGGPEKFFEHTSDAALAKYMGQHPKGDRSRHWVQQGRAHITGKLIDDLYKRALNGGFTYQAVLKSSPTTGYAVSPFKDAEQSWNLSEFKDRKQGIEAIKGYLRKNQAKFDDPKVHLGGWNDPQSGKVFLDLSKVVQDEGEAFTMAKAANQLAVFNLGKMESLYVK